MAVGSNPPGLLYQGGVAASSRCGLFPLDKRCPEPDEGGG